MPRFLVRDLSGDGRARLRGAELRHLRRVLRLGPGDRVELFDGKGGAFRAEIRSVTTSCAELQILDEVRRRTESPLRITLAMAVTKGAKLDWTVEKATELGVAAIRPFTSARTVVEPGSGARAARWRRIAESATVQSGRDACPEVAEVTTFTAVVQDAGRHDRAILFWERADAEPLGDLPPARRILAVTGPEGGFTDDEADAARSAGLALASLGPRILRAETAAIVAVTLCQLRWGDLAGGAS